MNVVSGLRSETSLPFDAHLVRQGAYSADTLPDSEPARRAPRYVLNKPLERPFKICNQILIKKPVWLYIVKGKYFFETQLHLHKMINRTYDPIVVIRNT